MFIFFHFMICFFIIKCATVGLQTVFRRANPPEPQPNDKGEPAKNARSFELREDNETCSMPAATSVQASFYIVFIVSNFPNAF
tara:strand:- start:136 stop:384 length:249 start_codon:yes stop_codon:yes gene_type:complete